MKLLLIFQLVSCFGVINSRPQQKANQCGYESCPKTLPNKINVHLVPHTHDDVGWLKTVDQYYYGSKTLTQKAGVQYILDSVVQELSKDAKRRFIYVESAFFFKWWQEQSPDLQEKVKQLVKEGRLEFIGGAWSMNDEATTHYQSLIDQFAWGLKKLNDTFGECGRPRIGWQIDPFGHSREMASMLAQMGFDGLFFARLDFEDKRKRLRTKTPEMVWHASTNLGKSSDLFTGILYNHYSAPPGFCFDVLCTDEPIIDGKHSPDNNVNEKITAFLTYIRKIAGNYRTNNLMVPMGDDFTYQDANMWYKNIDKLIKYGNAQQANGSEINIFYSTPSCYLKSLYDTGIAWPTKNEDFFPYSSDPYSFWAGYFTSRPTLKRYERIGNHFLQVCKQLSALLHVYDLSHERNLDALREAMGIMQHHDAITGTEKEKVAFDYAKQLHGAIEACNLNTNEALKKLITPQTPGERTKDLEFESCLNLNISACMVSEESHNFMITLYNPLSQSVSQYVRIPVEEGNYEVKDANGASLQTQMVPIPAAVKNLPFRFSTALYELVFRAENIPSHGVSTFFILKSNKGADPEVLLIRKGRDLKTDMSGDVTIGNKELKLTFNEKGILSSVETNGTSKHNLRQEFFFYEGAVGNNMVFVNRSSGAYIFRPNNTERPIANEVEIEVYKGPLFEEIHQKFSNWVSQVVRIYKGETHAEFEWLVGPIPVEDKIGKEVISRFSSDIESAGSFYTDSNGREMIKRQRNQRETFVPDLKEKVSGNYYPITSKIALEDKNARLAILTDRAQGGGSIQDGNLELMIHRRLLHDDAFGVGEALNEMAFGRGVVARGKHYLIFGAPTQTVQTIERDVQLKTLLPPWAFFTKLNSSTDLWRNNLARNVSLLPSLPQNIHVMTLESWGIGRYLIRFEYILEKSEVAQSSKTITFNINSILDSVGAAGYRETTLDGNQWLSDLTRLEFRTEDSRDRAENEETEKFSAPNEITLKPMEIKTFILFGKK